MHIADANTLALLPAGSAPENPVQTLRQSWIDDKNRNPPIVSTFHFVIVLGSNLNKIHNMRLAQARLSAHRELSIQACSALLDTPAVDAQGVLTGQPSYLNMAVRGTTELDYIGLRAELRQIEAALGRVRTGPKPAEVPIDLDIAIFGADLYSDHLYNEPLYNEHYADGHTATHTLRIHPDVATAAHVAVPIAQILPSWIHPEQKKSMQEIAQTLMDTRSPHSATHT